MDDDPYDEIILEYLGRDGVSAGRMITSRGLKLAGRFICFRRPDGLVVKVSEERSEALYAEGLGRFSPAEGRAPMRQWVHSPDAASDGWAALLEEAYDHRVASMGADKT